MTLPHVQQLPGVCTTHVHVKLSPCLYSPEAFPIRSHPTRRHRSSNVQAPPSGHPISRVVMPSSFAKVLSLSLGLGKGVVHGLLRRAQGALHRGNDLILQLLRRSERVVEGLLRTR